MQTELTPSEVKSLDQYEATITQGLKTYHEVGMALLAIRDQKLYRATHETFEAYCQTRWGFERRHAYRLMDAAEVAEHVSNWTQTPPENEAQARLLTPLTPEAQRIVWAVVEQTAPAGKVTAAHVQSVVNVFQEVMTTGAIDDGTGEQIAVSEVVRAAITEETYERMKRQEAYVQEALEKKDGKRLRKLLDEELYFDSIGNGTAIYQREGLRITVPIWKLPSGKLPDTLRLKLLVEVDE